jgi:hypothetical protein
MLTRIKVPNSDIKEQNWAMSKWEGIRQKLIQRNGASVSDEERTRQFEERRALAEKLFPIPQDNQDLSEGF